MKISPSQSSATAEFEDWDEQHYILEFNLSERLQSLKTCQEVDNKLTTLTKMPLLTNNTFKINNHEKGVFSIFLLFHTKTPIELLAPSEAFPESRLSASTCGQSEPASKDS